MLTKSRSRSRRGATLLATALSFAAICLGLSAVVMMYGQGYHRQELLAREELVASVNARSGIETTLAQIALEELDLGTVVEGLDIEVQDLKDLIDPGCSTPGSNSHVAAEIWRNPESQRGVFDVRILALNLGSTVGEDVRPWLRIDATGRFRGRERWLAAYLRPQGSGDGGTPPTPEPVSDHYQTYPYSLLHQGVVIERTLEQIATNMKTYKFDYFVFDGIVSTQQVKNFKLDICHFPPGNEDNPRELSVAINAIDVHISHHNDTIGGCGPVDGEEPGDVELFYLETGPVFDPVLNIPCPAEDLGDP